jgi:hypothetical protein
MAAFTSVRDGQSAFRPALSRRETEHSPSCGALQPDPRINHAKSCPQSQGARSALSHVPAKQWSRRHNGAAGRFVCTIQVRDAPRRLRWGDALRPQRASGRLRGQPACAGDPVVVGVRPRGYFNKRRRVSTSAA